MRIGQQLYEFLMYCTDTRSYCVDGIEYFKDAKGRTLCIKEIYVNDEENQVYLIVEDENHNQFHASVHTFITLMGSTRHESYAPLYHLRNEVAKVKRLEYLRYKRALRKQFPENYKIVKQIFKNLKNNESN